MVSTPRRRASWVRYSSSPVTSATSARSCMERSKSSTWDCAPPRSARATAALPALEQSVAEASRLMVEIQQRMNEIEQTIRVGDTRRENAAKVLAALGARRERLDAETRELALPVSDPIAAVAEQLEQENA